MQNSDGHWSHVLVDGGDGKPRISSTMFGPWLCEPEDAVAPFFVHLVDKESFEWLCGWAETYEDAINQARHDAASFGHLAVVDMVNGGSC